jgi:ketosteroid isomerase-like protein
MESTATSADFTVDVVGGVAVVFGKDSAKMTPVDGGPTTAVSGPAVSVFRRVDGTWKLARSLNLMAPVQPE